MNKIIYISKSKHLVTKSEKNQLNKLHYLDGQMFPEFQRKDKLGFVIMAMDGDRVAAWSLIFERDETKTFFVYVSTKYRRLGIGTALFRLAQNQFGNDLYTSKHNRIADKFFSKLEDS